ncbi:hypothetical protein LLH00_04645 [bacterium]|nr:hypothetical protein [bacterium]
MSIRRTRTRHSAPAVPAAGCGLLAVRRRARVRSSVPALLLLLCCLLIVPSRLFPAGAANFFEGEISELIWLSFSGRAADSFERVGVLLSHDPNDYRAYFIRATCYGWLNAVNPENRRYDNQFIESLDACIEYADKVNQKAPDFGRSLFFRTLALVTEARFKAFRGYSISSRWTTRAVIKAADELEQLYPEELDARFPRAVFDYYWGGSSMAGRVSQFLLTLPRGSREDGLKTLQECAHRGDGTRLWAELTLLDIYREDPANAEQALHSAERLHELFPDNAYFQVALADAYRERRQWVLAEAVYRSIQAKALNRLPGYDDVAFEISRLRTAECEVKLGKIEEAFGTVREILLANPINPEWIVPWAHYYAARVYRQRGQFKRAERACEYALNGVDYNDLHKVSREELETIRRLSENEK